MQFTPSPEACPGFNVPSDHDRVLHRDDWSRSGRFATYDTFASQERSQLDAHSSMSTLRRKGSRHGFFSVVGVVVGSLGARIASPAGGVWTPIVYTDHHADCRHHLRLAGWRGRSHERGRLDDEIRQGPGVGKSKRPLASPSLVDSVSPAILVARTSMKIEVWLILGVTMLAGLLAFRGRRRELGITVLAGVGLALLALWQTPTRTARRESRSELNAAVPREHRDQGYVGSDECQSCHPGEHRTWHDSYHRTMTTKVSPETVKAPFTGEPISFHGRSYRLTREGDEYFAELVDPAWEWDQRYGWRDAKNDAFDDPPVVKKRLVMITGSHHQQVFWMAGALPRQLDYFPLVWLVIDQRWRPLNDVFLHPPDRGEPMRLWNQNCIRCHAVRGIPGPEENQDGGWNWETSVGELGIACEACHGPGQAHVEAHRSPLGRWSARRDDKADSTIVNPAKLDHVRSSETCGICHGIIHSKSMNEWYRAGYGFAPGERIEGNEHLLRANADESRPFLDESRAQDPYFVARRYWDDGQVRVSGREYNGLIESPCFQKGTMSCLTCHQMHGSDPNDQLAPDRLDDASCTPCHQKIADDPESHTHHPVNSEGSRCLNCHMPHTTWGLLKSIRSHEITSPNLRLAQRARRPNACNLCHLDQTHAWTAEHLHSWYGQEIPELDEDAKTIAAGPMWLARGDAGVRAITAWHLSWPAAQATAGTDWALPWLAKTLSDPYRTVRYVAGRTLIGIVPTLPIGTHDDYLPDAALADHVSSLESQLPPLKIAADSRLRLLFLADGTPDLTRWADVLSRRDLRAVDLAE